MTRSWFRAALPAVLVVAATSGVSLGAVPAAQAATPTLFTYTGAEQTFTVPYDVDAVDVVAIGGKGGPGASTGGYGASVGAILPVTSGEVLYVEVGSNGDNSATAAFNGGGSGGSGGAGTGGSGGGASGVQTLPGSGASALGSRLLVAGGGGGGGGQSSGDFGGAAGSAGSALTADAAIGPGQPGTDVAGGAGGSGAYGGSDGGSGSDGAGGTGGTGASGSGGGGGGGGWFGGGGGGAGGGIPAGDARANGAGGAGGSNFVASAAINPQISTDSSGTPSVTIAPEPLPSSGAPTITLVSSENPAAVGDLPTFGAGLSPAPTCGSVSWLIDGAAPAAGVPMAGSNGSYTLGPVPGLTVGSHSVTAVFSGCATADATSGTLIETVSATSTGTPPSIAAHVSSAQPKHRGWYRTPVHVTFTCVAGSAPLDTSCPAPQTFSRSEGGQSVTATIADSAGRTATVKVSHINVDRVSPKLRVTGATNGKTYRSRRTLVCRASDILSGVASCRIHRHTHTVHGVTTVRWTATATDVAGNTTSSDGEYRVT